MPTTRDGLAYRIQALARYRADRGGKGEPEEAQGILRHTDAGLTMNIYTHAQDPAKRAARERFESRFVRSNTGKDRQHR